MFSSRRLVENAKCIWICQSKRVQSTETNVLPLARSKFTQTTVTTSEASRDLVRKRTTVSPLQAIWDVYVKSLHKNPLVTKASMAAAIFFVSDSASQYIISEEGLFKWSPSRALSGSSFGIVATVCLHYWWGFLEAVVNKRLPLATHKAANAATKVVLDQSIKAPLYIYTYYVLTNFLNEQMRMYGPTKKKHWRESWRDTNAKASDMLLPTMLLHWRLWIPVHSFNFYFVPLHHRVLVQNSILVFWSGYLSYLNHNQKHVVTPNDEMRAAMERRESLRQTEETSQKQ